MSRYTDIGLRTLALTEPSQLPAINWGLVGHSAPVVMAVSPANPSARLPAADAIVMTWTSAEWAAMDHVFIRNAVAESPSAAQPSPSTWYLYSRGAPGGSGSNRLWGYYQLLGIKSTNGQTHRILLFKSDAHLGHAPWLAGLQNELKDLLADVKPSRVFSIGTAGGANLNQNLGDVAITNAATAKLTHSENGHSPINGETFTCTSYFPNTTNLLPKVQQKLFFKLNSVVTEQEWERILEEAKNNPRDKSLIPYSLTDLLNPPIQPANLGAPKATAFQNIPLLTTDTYFIADGNAPYAALEMDDAVIAAVAKQSNVPFCFIRNISDAVVVTQDSHGKPIKSDARDAWSSEQYDHFGVYSSFNGALATWAVLTDW